MSIDCCKLVGNFPINSDKCFVSINVSSSTEASLIDNNTLIVGPTVGTVSITGPAQEKIHVGCPGRASVQIPWLRRWDCDNNQIHFIPQGEGRSSIFGDVSNLATLHKFIGKYRIVNASSSSGPAVIYTDEYQSDGYGLTYTGAPISFSTTKEGVTWDGEGLNLGVGTMYMQSFNVEFSPGQVPTASYSFVFVGSLA